MHSTGKTGEQAVAGRTSGLIELGETVTWRARHLGVRQSLTARITAFERPRYFEDTMDRGAFKSLRHGHFFDDAGGGVTVMRDVVDLQAPFGVLGLIAEWLFLTAYMRRFVEARNAVLKTIAESGEWTQFILDDETA